jgi:electron transport complex protein RnfG
MIKTIVKSSFLITFIGILFGILLNLTFTFTTPQIEKNIKDAKMNLLNESVGNLKYENNLLNDKIILGPNELLGNNTNTDAYIARDNNGTMVAVVIEATAHDGYGGDINLITGINKDGNILGVRIINHSETPGLGDYIEKKKSNWIDNFIGLNLSGDSSIWKTKKDMGQFYFRAGATITPRAVIKAVKKTLEYFKENQDKFK